MSRIRAKPPTALVRKLAAQAATGDHDETAGAAFAPNIFGRAVLQL